MSTLDYYPPRAGRGSRWRVVVERWGHRWAGEWRASGASQPSGGLMVVLVPGWVFVLRGAARWGRAIAGLYLAGLGMFIAGLGTIWATVGGGLMFGLHALSVSQAASGWLRELTVWRRAGAGLALSAGLALGVYLPLQRVLEWGVVMPLEIGSRQYLVSRLEAARSVQRHDRVAYRVAAVSLPGVRLEAGYGLGEVEGFPGERIRFGPTTYAVGGGAGRAVRAWMPQSGEWVVPEKHWFIWPDLSMNLDARAGLERHSGARRAVETAAMVAQADYRGRVLRRWLWRRLDDP